MGLKLFNNVIVYRYTGDVELPLRHVDVLNAKLGEKIARLPMSPELNTFGFVPVIPELGEEAPLIEEVVPGLCLIVRARLSERLLPSSVVKSEVTGVIKRIEREELRKVYSKERNQIKDEVVLKMLPQAFIKHSYLTAMITPSHVYVDSSSHNKAEAVISLLRKALGYLPVRPVSTKVPPYVTMTGWVKDKSSMPGTLSTGEAFKTLAEGDETSTLSGSNVDLSDLVDTGALDSRRVTELSLIHKDVDSDDSLTGFTLTESLVFRGIKWPEELTLELNDRLGESREDAIEIAKASYWLVSSQLIHVVRDTLEALGGEEIPQGMSDTQTEDDDLEDLL